MILISNMLIKFRNDFLPKIHGSIFKFLYSSKHIKIGKNFHCHTFPSIWMTGKGKLIIGDDVIFKEGVEVRVHKDAHIRIDQKVKIDRGVRLLATNNSRIDISEKVRIGLYCVLNGGDSIFIGENTLISGFVYLQTSMHNYLENNKYIAEQGYTHAPIELNKDVWLGAHVVIMPGVKIGKGGIVGSNAVVTKDVSENEIVAGIPAKYIKNRG